MALSFMDQCNGLQAICLIVRRRIPLFITAQAVNRIVKHFNEFFNLRYILLIRLQNSHDFTCSKGCSDGQLCDSLYTRLSQKRTQCICTHHCSIGLQHAVIYIHHKVCLAFQKANLSMRANSKYCLVSVVFQSISSNDFVHFRVIKSAKPLKLCSYLLLLELLLSLI